MFAAATNSIVVISTPTNKTTTKSFFSSSRRRPPPPPFVCASVSKSTHKTQEKDIERNKTVETNVDRRDVLTKAALVASVAMTTMTPKPVRAHFFCKRRRRRRRSFIL
jgi:hypothetical protein